MEHLLNEISARLELARKSSRWAGRCPECGGSSTTDRFSLYDTGSYRCFSCGIKGDIISWLRTYEGKTCPEAHQLAGQSCRIASSCPVAGKCRLGDGTTHRNHTPGPRALTPRPEPRAQGLGISRPNTPAQLWQRWAEALVTEAAATLARTPAALAWLAARGIDQAAATRFRLGWRPRNTKADRAANGIPPREGKPELWVPAGLVIPIYPDPASPDPGAIHRVRIRRPASERTRFLPKRKYEWIEGSGKSVMVIRPTVTPSRGTVVVEAELDAEAIAVAHPQVTIIALGTVINPLPAYLLAELADPLATPVILVALDADPAEDPDGNQDTKLGAGPKAVAAWLAQFRTARYWPTPAGKDAGDYAKDHQGDLAAWIDAGLPPAPVRPTITPQPPKQAAPVAPPRQDLAPTPDRDQQGGEGEEVQILHLRDGREILLTDDQPTWQRLTDQGRPVFTRHELARLVAAAEACQDPAEAKTLADAALLAKQTFGGYIHHGGPATPDPVEPAAQQPRPTTLNQRRITT